MTVLLMFSLIATSIFSTVSMAATKNWKAIAETTSCPETVQILAKEGEKYVIASYKNSQKKLYSSENAVFTSKALKSQEFKSDPTKEKYLLGEPTFIFFQQGEVEGNPPKIQISISGHQERCSMNVL